MMTMMMRLLVATAAASLRSSPLWMLNMSTISGSGGGGGTAKSQVVYDIFQRLRQNKNEIFLLDGGTGEEL